MYGYIYKTINTITNEIYIGKKKSDKFIATYYGSGKNIKNQIKIYGKNIFNVVLLDYANNKDELNKLEKMYIKNYKKAYKKKCLNLAKGGDGGSVYEYADSSVRKDFSNKMQKINSLRCNSNEFKKNCSIRMKKKYSCSSERKKQSIKIRKSWENIELRNIQSKKLKDYYSTHIKDNSYNNKKCKIVINDETIYFKSVSDLKSYLKKKYDYIPDNKTLKKIIHNSINNIGYKPYHKNNKKLFKLCGMKIFILDEGVETN